MMFMKYIISRNYKSNRIILYSILWLILSMFAALRLVNASGIGGRDAYNYETIFLNPNDLSGERLEPLFLLYVKSAALLTSTPEIYRFISYGIIAASYCYVLYTFCKSKKLSAIPFILIIFPYLKGFNTMRSTFAISIFLVGIVLLYKRKNILAPIFILASVFFHRMSIVYVAFIFFYYIFKNVNFSNSRILFIVLLVFTSAGYIISLKLQPLILLSQADSLQSNDIEYLAKSLDNSLFERIPLIFQHILMAIALFFLNTKLPPTKELIYIRLLIIYDLVIIAPASISFGMWRSMEYLYIPRLIMWSYLIFTFLKDFSARSKPILNFGIFGIFSFWLIFRIYKEWDATGITPYLLCL